MHDRYVVEVSGLSDTVAKMRDEENRKSERAEQLPGPMIEANEIQ